MAKKRSDFQQTLRPKRKLTALEIIGNIIIWASPIIMGISIFIANFEVVQSAPTSVKTEFWVILVLIGIMFGYSSFGKTALNDAIQVRKANAEKITPLLSLADGICSLIPIAIAILTLDFLKGINEPIEIFLIVLLCVQAFGRLILFFDSFKEAEYE